MSRYRAEKWQISYGVESAYGEAPTGATNAQYTLGVFDDATLPDPEFEHTPYWVMKTGVDRGPSIMYRGKARYSASIPNIVILDGRSLVLPIFNDMTHGGAGQNFTHAAPGATATSDLPSIKLVAAYYDETGTAGLIRYWSGGKINRATFHAEEGGMLMMSIDELLFKQVYFGNADDILISPFYNAAVVSQTGINFPDNIAISGVQHPQEPFYFSECEVKLRVMQFAGSASTPVEVIIPSVRNFRLEINNNCTPRYYLNNVGALDDAHGPYEIIEGRREIRLSMQVDLSDYAVGAFSKDDLFLNLLRQGRQSPSGLGYTAIQGVAAQIKFQRANYSTHYIQFQTPSNYGSETFGLNNQGALIVRAPHNIVPEDLVSVPMEMICRDVDLYIVDPIQGDGTFPDRYPIQ